MNMQTACTPSKMASEDAHASFKTFESDGSLGADRKLSPCLCARREATRRKTCAAGRSQAPTQAGRSQALAPRGSQAFKARQQADGQAGPEARSGNFPRRGQATRAGTS